MFERYTEAARRVVLWARFFACQVGSPKIEAEHLLLGILRQDMKLASRFFGSPWALEEVWKNLEQSGCLYEKSSVSGDLLLADTSKNAMVLAAEEADAVASGRIGTSHLLLGLLREKNCIAAKILHNRNVHLATTRAGLMQVPHDDSLNEEFVRERDPLPPDVVEVQTRIRSVANRMSAALAEGDYAKARAYTNEERTERDRLYRLCQQHRLPDWLYE